MLLDQKWRVVKVGYWKLVLEDVLWASMWAGGCGLGDVGWASDQHLPRDQWVYVHCPAR